MSTAKRPASRRSSASPPGLPTNPSTRQTDLAQPQSIPIFSTHSQYPALPPNLAEFLKHRKEYGQSPERMAVWKHYKRLLSEVGYELAWEGDIKDDSNGLKDPTDPWYPLPDESLAFATLGRNGTRWAGPSFWPSLAGAYDFMQRFVVVKVVESSSTELAILTELSTPPRDATNHTIPVLRVIEAGEWTLVVMPSWELNIYSHPCWQPQEYLDVASQCIEGLAYMHGKNIAHLDIYPLNIVLNHVTHVRGASNRPLLTTFKSRFAFIDFGYSVQFSTNTLPAQRVVQSSQTPLTYREIPEVANEDTFDPFPADVYALAKTLKGQLNNDRELCARMKSPSPSDAVPRVVPEYINLLEKMMDADPTRRPTAAAALVELRLVGQVLQSRL